MASQVRPVAANNAGQSFSAGTSGMNYRYWPIFTIGYVFVQVSMTIWVCQVGEITSNGLQPIQRTRLEPLTFKGPTLINLTEYPNPWFGPSKPSLVQLGALFPPCMRTEHRHNFQFALAWSNMELRLGREKLGCCEAKTLNIAGTMTKKQCQMMSAPNNTEWKPLQCNQRRTGENFIAHVIRPCCEALTSKCHMMSPQHCSFIGGAYHLHADHCYQVDCLVHLCDANLELQGIDDTHLSSAGLPPSYHQWWRFLLTVYYPYGAVDGTILTVLGTPFCLIIERKIGWLRMVLVYTTAGVGGHLIGSLFSESTSVTVGGGPSLTGILTASIIYFLKAKPQHFRPFLHIFCYFLALVFLFVLHSFPLLNNFSNFWGLILGIILGFIYLPNLDLKRKHAVRVICLLLIILVFIVSLFIFYQVQPSCTWCKNLNCVPYSKGWCG